MPANSELAEGVSNSLASRRVRHRPEVSIKRAVLQTKFSGASNTVHHCVTFNMGVDLGGDWEFADGMGFELTWRGSALKD